MTYAPTNPPYPGYPSYQQSPWPAPLPGIQPVKKKSWMPRLIIIVSVFVIAGPLIASMLSSEPKPTPTPTPPTTANVPPTTPAPTHSGSGAPGTYTPGPPDLHPDDPPFPETDTEVTMSLENNPLYTESLIPTQCEITNIDLVNAPVADIEEHMNEFVDCLMETWYAPVYDAGFTLPHPSVTVYTTEINSACGQLPIYNAAYCTADQQIYYGKQLILAFPSSMQAMRFLAESVIAHEFGHAVQYRSMILASEYYRETSADTDAASMDFSRRLELQADCFAGSFMNAVSASTDLTDQDEANIVSFFTSIGGTTPYSDDHGTGANRAFWVTEGMHDWSVGTCNTFTAPDDEVG